MTSITYEGKEYRLAQDAYIVDEETYEALAVGHDGEEVMVTWNTVAGWDSEQDDEEDACDWDSPACVTPL